MTAKGTANKKNISSNMRTANKKNSSSELKGAKSQTKSVLFFIEYSIFIVDIKSGRFMYQSGRAGDKAEKHKSPAKSGSFITVWIIYSGMMPPYDHPVYKINSLILL